jgi:hypothetical protein
VPTELGWEALKAKRLSWGTKDGIPWLGIADSDLKSILAQNAELLEALKHALDRMEAIDDNRYGGFTPACEAAIAFAKSAIAKAEGR